jgi:hypothetical protein
MIKLILQALLKSAQHLHEKREGSGSGSVSLTNAYGRPKNLKILLIRNTANAKSYLAPTNRGKGDNDSQF